MEDDDRVLHSYLKRPGGGRLVKVVERYQDFVWKTSLRLTRCEETAADICQDVFLKLLLDPPEPRDVRSARGFLRWEVVDRATRMWRTEASRREREHRHLKETSGETINDEDVILIRSAIAELPDDLRETVTLRYLLGVLAEDICPANLHRP